MLLTITTTRAPATDLGWLLHKHPDRVQTFNLAFGPAYVFYPHASTDRCTVALVLDIDPIGLVRNRRGAAGDGFSLQQYVNDRPYVASSFMSVAIAQVFGTALSGRSKDRPERVDEVLPLEAHLASVPARGGADLLQGLFEPLGYAVETTRQPLDVTFPEWGDSCYHALTLRGNHRLQDLLSHLYVLIPVLDNDKHYWVAEDELEKLLRHGAGWLASHPENELISHRYLKYQRRLARAALARLADDGDPDAEADEHTREENRLEAAVVVTGDSGPEASPADAVDPPERGPTLNTQRLATVLAALRACDAQSVVDLGCGEGKLLKLLLDDSQFTRIVGMDVSMRALHIAAERLRLDRLPERKRQRIELVQGSLMYRDQRLAGFDAAACVEVIEHLDAPRLAAFDRVVFEFARPRTVIVTTPNREYNVMWAALPAGRFRHRDHRFEWTRDEFENWARSIGERYAYACRFLPVGPVDPAVGAPTQMAVLTREATRPAGDIPC